MCEGQRVLSFTAFEVSKHCFQHDCWVIIGGKVYDVTSYVPRHPGGALIYVKAGGDCTQLFESYHLNIKRAGTVLEKYYVGELKETNDLSCTHYEKEGEHDEFYSELKQEVSAYFQDNKLNPRTSVSLYIKAAAIILTVAVSAYMAFFGTSSYTVRYNSYFGLPDQRKAHTLGSCGTVYRVVCRHDSALNMQVALISAVVLGFFMAEVGTCIQHDANHGAFSTNPWICHIVGLTLDICGASSFMWKQQHVVGHHVYTNVKSEDPDVCVVTARLAPWQKHAAYHTLQHIYLAALYGTLALKTILLSDFAAYATGNIGPVQLGKLNDHEVVVLYAGKILYACWYVGAPLLWSSWSLLQLVGIWAVAQFVTGWTLALMFQVAHVVCEVNFLEKGKNGKVAGSWAAQQMATTADFSHDSFFWTHISGGLNYQVVHHLFPGVNHTHYPALAPIIKRIADKHGVKYFAFSSFWAALGDHFKHLRRMGRFAVAPSLHALG